MTITAEGLAKWTDVPQSDLLVARETNRRLNRRLGSMEHDLHSLTSIAQQECGAAQKRAGRAQEDRDYWLRRYERELDARYGGYSTNLRVWIALGLSWTIIVLGGILFW